MRFHPNLYAGDRSTFGRTKDGKEIAAFGNWKEKGAMTDDVSWIGVTTLSLHEPFALSKGVGGELKLFRGPSRRSIRCFWAST